MKYRLNNVWKSIMAVFLASLALTGCGNAIPDMTVEEEQAIGEYAAFMLLKYDINHKSRLVDLSKVVEKEPKPETPVDNQENKEAEGMPPVADTPVIDKTQNSVASLEAFFGLPEGISFVYQGMQVCTSYQEPGQSEGHFTLEASEGKSLLMLQYQVSNQSQEVQRVDLFGQSPVFKITVNGSYTRTALMTILTNDMSTYREDLQPGEVRDIVLPVEVDQNVAESVTSVSLEVKNESNAYTISLL